MKRIVLLLLAGAAACTTQEGVESTAAGSSQSSELAGRTAEAPVSCVSQRELRGNRSLGDAILFEGTGGVVYVNRPAGGCPALNSGRALITRTTSSRLCRGDIVTVLDPVSGVEFGGCGLGDFVPYRRAD